MKLVKDKIKISKLNEMANESLFSLVKVVVDVNRRIMMIEAEMHADEEQSLLDSGSKQVDLWGINLYPDKFGTNEFIEYDSMINLRPNDHNLSRGVDDVKLRELIKEVVLDLIEHE